jgi:hypothetical protein
MWHTSAPAARRESREPPGARVDLQDLERAVPLVVLELGAEDAAVVDPRSRRVRLDGARDLGKRDRLGGGAVSEIRRVHPQAPSGEHPAEAPAAVDEALDETVRVAGPGMYSCSIISKPLPVASS